jgi:hypothetical protein
MGAADQPHQIEVALLVLDQQRQPVGRRQLAGGGDAALLLARMARSQPIERLDAGLGGVLGEFERAEQVIAVGDGDRRHGVLRASATTLSTLFAPSVRE